MCVYIYIYILSDPGSRFGQRRLVVQNQEALVATMEA